MKWDQTLLNLFDRHSKTEILQHLQDHPEEIGSLLPYIQGSKEKMAWRAAWILDLLNRQASELIQPYLPQLTILLKTTPYYGVRRILLKVLRTNPGWNIEDGILVDLCFQWIVDSKSPIAVRAQAMKLIYELLPGYPDLAMELKSALEMASQDDAKGVRSCANKLLTKL